jgi:hypothetical protein
MDTKTHTTASFEVFKLGYMSITLEFDSFENCEGRVTFRNNDTIEYIEFFATRFQKDYAMSEALKQASKLMFVETFHAENS